MKVLNLQISHNDNILLSINRENEQHLVFYKLYKKSFFELYKCYLSLIHNYDPHISIQ